MENIIFSACGKLKSQDQFLHQKRCFDEDVLIIVTEGILYIKSGDASFKVSPGQYILLKAGLLHEGTQPSNGPLSYMWAHFKTSLCTSAPEYGSISNLSRVSQLFNQLMDLSLDEGPYVYDMQAMAMGLLFAELLRQQSVSSSKNDDVPATIQMIAAYIRENYFRPLKVSELSERFGYQSDYLSSIFKKHMGQSITAYTNDIRIKSSKALLNNYDLSIDQVAYSCGFQDGKYFMKVFKKAEGMTPSEYKHAFSKSHLLFR